MKKIFSVFFLFSTINVFCQSQDQNYIKTTELLEPVDINTFHNFSNSIKKVESVTYLDGFGKAKQTLAIRQSPNKKDIIQHIEYDQFGRTSKQYLALPTSQNSGNYVSNAQSQISTYYQNSFADQHPFSEISYDNSPLNRTIESSSPGNTWQLLNNSDTDHTIKYEHGVNGINEVLFFKIINETENPFQISYYQKNRLFKNITKNENWTQADGLLNSKEVFTDKNGRKIAEFTYESDNNIIKKLSTYYVYDKIGNLRYVITPKAIENLYVDNNYAPFNLTFDWSQFVVDPSSVSNGSGNVNIISEPTSNNHKLTLDFNLGFPFVFGGNGGAYLKQGNVVALPSNANLPNKYLFSIYGKKAGLILLDDFEDFGATSGNVSKSRYEYSIKDGYIFVEFFVGTNIGSPAIPFKVRGIDRTFNRYFSTTSFNESIMGNLCFRYKYDQFNRQIEQKVPGKGWEYMVYDQLDRPILTQDANLKAQNKWLFNKYDVFGRVVYNGKYSNSSSRATLQTQVDNFINSSSNKANIVSRTNTISNIGGVAINYTNDAFPNTNQETLTVIYFDDYNFTDSNLPTIPIHILDQEVTSRTKGLLTATWTKTLASNTWSKNYTFYDKKGRVIYAHDKNHLGGYTQNKSKLDFRGKIEYSVTNHKRLNTNADLSIVDRFEYDHAERPKKHYQQINSQEEELIAQNTYNELGQLEKKNVGGLGVDTTNDLYENINNSISITSDIIEKTASSSWSLAGTLTTKGEITNEGSISYEVLTTNKPMMIGLAVPNTDPHYNSINYAIYNYTLADPNGGSKLYIRELGMNKGYKTNYEIGDILSVERDVNGYIHYKKNGTIFWSSDSNTLPFSGTLIGDVSMPTSGGKIKNLKISSDYIDIVGFNVSNITDNTQQIKKETSSGWGNAGLATVNAIKQDSDGYLSYKISQTNKYLMVGLSQNNLNANYNNLKYAIYHKSNGTLEIRITEPSEIYNENITYQTGDEFSIERVGSNLHFKKNGDIFFTKSGVALDSLIGDVSFHTIGAAIYDLRIENNESGLQTIDYRYNIRGWLTNINDVNNLGEDLFAYNLKYDEAIEGSAPVSNIYNGNIKQVVWKSAKNNLKKSYSYEYDKLNRFSRSHYRENNNLTGGAGNFETDRVKYDLNGNIRSVKRTTHLGGLMDRLAYRYDEGNKLLSIRDFGGNNEGFKDGANSGQDYYYDANGNLIKDLNKNITNVEYNHLDLVKHVTFISGQKIEFTYDANGKKLQMKTTNPLDGITTVDYLGGFQYTNSQLQFFSTPEGYVANDTGTFKYVYLYKDHLGNNRVSFADGNNDGSIHPINEILSNTDHYVMGLKHNDEFISGIGSNYNYKFQGKEKLAFAGYNMYDFGSRMYDPAVGRWFATDPQNQFGSPYIALGNNWVMMVDQNGEIAWVPVIIGAVLGAYSAGTIANNGEYNPFKWKWDSKTFGSVIGGAIIGGVSAGLGSAVSAGGGILANTMGMVSGSFVSSVGMSFLSGQNNVSVNFGVASYNLSNGDVGYLGEKGNKFIEDFGYGLGLVQNINDVMVGFKKSDVGDVELITEHSDEIGHSALVEPGTMTKSSIVDFGPTDGFSLNPLKSNGGTNSYGNHITDVNPNIWRTTVKGINKAKVIRYGNNLSTNTPRYNVYFSSCVTHTSSALMRSGFINIGVHPYILAAQVYLRDIGVRSIYFNNYLANDFYDEGN